MAFDELMASQSSSCNKSNRNEVCLNIVMRSLIFTKLIKGSQIASTLFSMQIYEKFCKKILYLRLVFGFTVCTYD